MLQYLLQVVLEWVLGASRPSHRVFGALGYVTMSSTRFLDHLGDLSFLVPLKSEYSHHIPG